MVTGLRFTYPVRRRVKIYGYIFFKSRVYIHLHINSFSVNRVPIFFVPVYSPCRAEMLAVAVLAGRALLLFLGRTALEEGKASVYLSAGQAAS